MATTCVKFSGGGGIAFFVKKSEIRGVKDFNISVAADTEDQTSGGEKYIKKKNNGGYQIGITAVLNAALGVDVHKLALKMAECARTGETGYFYTYSTKLFPSCFMCTDAKISNIQMTSKGKWSYCEVAWTMKQCSKYDGTTATSSGGGGTKKSGGGAPKESFWDKVKGIVTSAMSSVDKVKNLVQGVVGTINTAKAASAKAYTNLAVKKPNGPAGVTRLMTTK